MILKEIAMDLPYKKDEKRIKKIQEASGINYAEAVKRDYDLNWNEKRNNINLITRCMTSMVERLMPRIKTEDFWKILIECTETVNDDRCIVLSGVCCFQIQFDYGYFYQLNDDGKKVYVIDKTIEAIDKLGKFGKIEEIHIREIKEACYKVKELNYINKWFWGKKARNNDKIAQIKVSHAVDNVTLYMVFLNKKKEVLEEIPLVSTKPDEWAYAFYLGDLKWISDNSAELTMQKFALEKCEDLIVRKGNNFIARIKKYTEI